LLQAGASWCPPCKILKPKLLEAVKRHNGAVELLYIDIDKFQDIAQMLKIQSVPVVYIIKNGMLIDQFGGVADDDKIEQFI
jgi:thioredoxin-like negative regulator of GroEL